MNSTLTAIASEDGPQRPSVPTSFLKLDSSVLPMVQAQMTNLTALVGQLSNQVGGLQIENAHLRTSLKARKRHERDFDQSLSVLIDQAGEAELNIEDLQDAVGRLRRQVRQLQRPTKSQRRGQGRLIKPAQQFRVVGGH